MQVKETTCLEAKIAGLKAKAKAYWLEIERLSQELETYEIVSSELHDWQDRLRTAFSQVGVSQTDANNLNRGWVAYQKKIKDLIAAAHEILDSRDSNSTRVEMIDFEAGKHQRLQM